MKLLNVKLMSGRFQKLTPQAIGPPEPVLSPIHTSPQMKVIKVKS